MKIHAKPGRQTFVLQRNGKVVARKTVIVKIKA